MTAHDHRTLVPGCYRCELDKYEVMNALAKSRWVVAEDCFDVGRHVVADLPAMQPGDSVRVTMREDGRFDVVPLFDGIGVDWCSVHCGVRNEDEADCDSRRWDYETDEDGEPRECVVVPLWVDAPEQENDR